MLEEKGAMAYTIIVAANALIQLQCKCMPFAGAACEYLEIQVVQL
jgi:F0F1-type ATP synthase alpha subunit